MSAFCQIHNTFSFKKSVGNVIALTAIFNSGLRPGIQKTSSFLTIRPNTVDSGSKPGMTVCHRLLKRM